MALGPIPFTAIVEYSKLYAIEDIEEFRYVIRRMDDFLLDHEGKKKPKKEANGPVNSNSTNQNPN